MLAVCNPLAMAAPHACTALDCLATVASDRDYTPVIDAARDVRLVLRGVCDSTATTATTAPTLQDKPTAAPEPLKCVTLKLKGLNSDAPCATLEDLAASFLRNLPHGKDKTGFPSDVLEALRKPARSLRKRLVTKNVACKRRAASMALLERVAPTPDKLQVRRLANDAHRKTVEDLHRLADWYVEKRPRRNNPSQVDKYYIHKHTHCKVRSLKEVESYEQTLKATWEP